MISLSCKQLGGGVGRRLCMPIYSGSSDSVFKDKHFVLKKINHKYENVLLFGDVNKLRSTAVDLIRTISGKSENSNADYENINFKRYGGRKEIKSIEVKNEKNLENDITVNDYSTEDSDLLTGNDNNLEKVIISSQNKNLEIRKKLSFWQIYSLRVKKSLHLFNLRDFALILQSFHLYNKDTGIYVSSVKHIDRQVASMNGISFVIILNILSKRLKKNNYNDFFKKMMNYLPNVIYELNIQDMNNILNCFYNLELSNTTVCEMFCPKIISNLDKVEDTYTLSSLCYIFYKYDFENLHFFECLKKRGLCLLNDFDATEFYRFIFSLYKKNICLKDIIEKKKNDVFTFLSNYNDEEKLFMCKFFGIK
ncbi:conserved Plasmodium protein, unknown function [Plasmodium malariae]|uniref:Uncharacterized protein n=1 Tax=Plasmodium malariae TaxID=5858 RepID=A0A1C3KBC3_PLAMA|nr:conserved Plasmodium protein, unknown function [Plasmodium malariae]